MKRARGLKAEIYLKGTWWWMCLVVYGNTSSNFCRSNYWNFEHEKFQHFNFINFEGQNWTLYWEDWRRKNSETVIIVWIERLIKEHQDKKWCQ